ncbi:MAG: dihydroorotase [candidate division FCPU426 bacterium]
MKILIKNARLIDPAAGVDGLASLLVENGKVIEVALGAKTNIDAAGAEVVDASGLWLIPGLVDMHVHLREPGQEGKETLVSGTRAAAAGGVTSLVAMPNTVPATDSVPILEWVKAKAKAEGLVNVYPSAAVTIGRAGAELTEIGELAKAGAVMLTDDGDPVMNAELMRRALEYASMFGLMIMQHCEDKALSGGGVMNEGAVATRLGLRGIPKTAESVMVARDILLAEATNGRVHMGHLSGAAGVDQVRAAKKRGLKNVSCETAPHYFTLSDEWIGSHDYDSSGKMNPPLGSGVDRSAVIEGLCDGTIDAIATDHAPHSTLDKNVEFDKAAFGIVGLETCLALTLTELVHKKVVSPTRAVELLSSNPASLLGLKGKGTLKVGSDADLCLVDPDAEWTVDREKFLSKGRNTPFHGMKLRGRVAKTMVNGRFVYDFEKGIL